MFCRSSELADVVAVIEADTRRSPHPLTVGSYPDANGNFLTDEERYCQKKQYIAGVSGKIA